MSLPDHHSPFRALPAISLRSPSCARGCFALDPSALYRARAELRTGDEPLRSASRTISPNRTNGIAPTARISRTNRRGRGLGTRRARWRARDDVRPHPANGTSSGLQSPTVPRPFPDTAGEAAITALCQHVLARPSWRVGRCQTGRATRDATAGRGATLGASEQRARALSCTSPAARKPRAFGPARSTSQSIEAPRQPRCQREAAVSDRAIKITCGHTCSCSCMRVVYVFMWLWDAFLAHS